MAEDTVYDRLRAEIVGGRLQTGARLVAAEIAERYSSSTNPVREALQQLRGEGLVEILPNRGARVRAVSADFIRDISEIEQLVEPYLARAFVRIALPEDIARLAAIQEQIEANDFADLALHHRLDFQFHQTMYDAHYNSQADAVWKRNRALIDAVGHRFTVSPRRRSQVKEEHRAIIAAVRAGDEEGTARIVADHVRGSALHLIEHIGRADRSQGERSLAS
jgi:DNA-binding GntR family transcriptional regulator